MENKKGPFKKGRCGSFQVSLFRSQRRMEAKDDYDIECTLETVRVCIQHSRYVGRTWDRQQIWCSPDELRDLAQALDGLQHQQTLEGDLPCI